MRTRRCSKFAAAVAAGSLVLAPVLQARAQAAAQNAAPPAGTPAAPEAGGQTQSADLPSRVGRLAKISGTVSFHTADEDHWDAATLNYPVTSGDAFWTEPDARASLEISASRIDMASTTEFDVDQLDDHSLTATQAQGETFLDMRDLAPGETWTVRTPRGVVTMAAAGQYGIAAGDTQSPTTVTVLTGSAQISGANLSLTVPAGQTATITGSGASDDAFRGSVGPAQRDTFLASELTQGVPTATDATAQATISAHAPPPSSGPCDTNVAPAAVQQMPGGRQLSSYGTWQNNSQYGRIWYPQVSQDWVPYRDGHWAWVAPWGWTWIDNAPWGYAPFHYGRWVQAGARWAWAPTWWGPGFVAPPFYRPVYAPALVGFFGFGVGLAAGLSIGIGFGWGWGHIGWCPLGWGEPFRPWFHTGPGFFGRVNRFVVNNGTININKTVNITKNITINNFANAARGATVVRTSAMLNSERVSSVARGLSRSQFADVHLVHNTPRPTANTRGITPRAAERMGLPNAAHADAGRAAPGPRLTGGQRHGGAVPLRQPRAGSGAHTPRMAAADTRAGAEAGRMGRQGPGALPAARGSAEAQAVQAGSRAGAAEAARATQPALRGAGVNEARASQAAARNRLPALRAAGAGPRAAGGAPGPAFTPRDGQRGLAANAAAGRTAFAANEARRGAPGPAIERHTGAANGFSGHAGLPSLRTPVAAPGRMQAGRGFGVTPEARGSLNAGSAQRDLRQGRGYQPQRPQAPESRAAAQPRYQAPQSRQPQYRQPQSQQQQYRQQQYRQPQYQRPQYQQQYRQQQYRQPNYQRPQYQRPQYQQQYRQQYRQPYAAPRYQYHAPRYQAAPRYNMPAQHFAGPRGGAPGGRHPWIP